MRALAALVLALGACGGSNRDDAPTVASALPSFGPDPVIVRMPLEGGLARAYRYASPDSVIWTASESMPEMDRTLSFDVENGILAYLAKSGAPGWLDLRMGTVRQATKERLTSLTSADGWAIFGVNAENAVVRLTPSGDWVRPTTRKIRRLFPLADGSLLVLADAGAESVLLRLRPPDEAITDSLSIPRPTRAVPTPLGDRLYLGVARELLSVQPHSFENVDRVKAEDDILAVAPTPSGDRIFVANKGGPRLEVMNRYSEDIENSVRLPGLVTELRMDPMGRYLLARPVQGDSAWVVAIATDELVGTVKTAWRVDLPSVTADGLIAAVRGDTVSFVNPLDGTVSRAIPGGAADLWFFGLWNGFRARARGLDEPVEFSLGGERVAADSVADSLRAATPGTPAVRRDTAETVAPPVLPQEPARAPAVRDAWTVSFAAVLSEERAREIAAGISVDGQRPRVVRGETAGTTVFRVVFGPYNSKADAERMGRASRHNYWVYEGVP